jgi:hypothetical protein
MPEQAAPGGPASYNAAYTAKLQDGLVPRGGKDGGGIPAGGELGQGRYMRNFAQKTGIQEPRFADEEAACLGNMSRGSPEFYFAKLHRGEGRFYACCLGRKHGNIVTFMENLYNYFVM